MRSPSGKIKHLGILLFTLIGWHICWGQVQLLDHKITFSNKDYSIYDLTRSIEKQMDVSFSYNSKTISSSKRILLKNRITDLKSVLYLLQKEYGIHAKLSGNHIILVMDKNFRPEKTAPKKKVKSTASQKKKAGFVAPPVETASPDDLFAPAVSAIPASDSAAFVAEVLNKDSFLSQASSSGGGGGGSAGSRELKQTSKRVSNIQQKGIAVAGVYADESFYINPFAGIGYQFISAQLIYAFRPDLGHWRYGAAIQVPVHERMDLSLFANYGKMQKPVPYSYADTVLIPDDPDSPVEINIHEGSIEARGKLLKIGFTASYRINHNISVFVSPVLNFLSTTYHQNSIPTPLIDIIPDPTAIREEDFELFRTRLNLNSDFNPGNVSYRKSWLGIQIGLTYDFLKRKKAKE